MVRALALIGPLRTPRCTLSAQQMVLYLSTNSAWYVPRRLLSYHLMVFLRVVQSLQSLCSGFSYCLNCLSIIQVFYVWNGRGARPKEKAAAFEYANSLCGDAGSVVVLDEGMNDEDEMFWAILGDGDREYANASHWTWRAGVDAGDPQIWKISASPTHQVGSVYCTPKRG